MASHNIIGCEAIADHRKRLVAFSHVHGSIRMFPRRRRGLVPLITFLAGLAAPIAVVLLLAHSGA